MAALHVIAVLHVMAVLHVHAWPWGPRHIKLGWGASSKEQLQRLSSCCPAVESLSFILKGSDWPSRGIECLHLRHLSTLNRLQVCLCGSQAEAVATAAAMLLSVAAQLTELRSLEAKLTRTAVGQDYCRRHLNIPRPVLLRLTALTALDRLSLDGLSLYNKVGVCGLVASSSSGSGQRNHLVTNTVLFCIVPTATCSLCRNQLDALK